MPSNEVIKMTLFGMNRDSALGPDGFSGSFFCSCWNIVGNNVISEVYEFFRFGSMFKNLNSNFLVLIPKTDSTATPEKFRLIILGTLFSK